MSGPTCSDGSAAADEQLSGTAPHAVGWVMLQQDGPWGPRALTDSHLDPGVGRALEQAAAAHDVRPSLIRSPGRQADGHGHARSRRVLVAHTHPGNPWLLDGHVEDPRQLLDLNFAAVRDGDADAVRRSLPVLELSDRPHLLVCTNGRRDMCCAVKGRPLALGAAPAHPGQVWEVTHTSGHRFAPTAVLLPAGTLHGRLDVAGADEVLRAAARGATVIHGGRGRSCWPGPAQAAELAVREEHQVVGLHDLEVTDHQELAGGWTTTLTHTDGRAWRVRTMAEAAGTARAESCGKALAPMTWTTHAVETTSARS